MVHNSAEYTNQAQLFLINLAGSKDRLAAARKQFEAFGIAFERIEAVYGKALSPQQLNQYYCAKLNARQFYRPLSVGEIGCYISHLKALQQIVARQLPYAFIFEDDFQLQPQFRDCLSLPSTIAFKWDVIKLAPYGKKSYHSDFAIPLPSGEQLVSQRKVSTGACAHLISLDGAKKILAAAVPFGRPFDTDLQYFWEKDLDIFMLEPHPVLQGTNFASTIAAQSDPKSKSGGFFKKQWLQIRKFIYNRHYQAQNRVKYQAYLHQ